MEDFEVTDSMLSHPSDLHGVGHIHRTMFHSLLIARTMGFDSIFPEVLCAAFLHDLSREHDGPCDRHGCWAVERKLARLESKFIAAGVKDMDLVVDAVYKHCLPDESFPSNRVLAVLKDADALDRCRLGDLDPSQLRLERTPMFVNRAHRLYEATNTPETSNWANAWKTGVEIYNPHLGFADKHPPQFDLAEPATVRMFRRVRSGELGDAEQKLTALHSAMCCFPALSRMNETFPVESVTPTIYLSDASLDAFNRNGEFKSLWEIGPTWHYRYNDNPMDARAFNEVRLFGESCGRMAHGVAWMHMGDGGFDNDQRLREMYGARRITLHKRVLDSASFTINDSQLSRFAMPFSMRNLRVAMMLHLVGEIAEDDQIASLFGDGKLRFIELQFHEPVRWYDIVEVG